MVGVMGALILAPLTPLIGAFFTLFSITTSIIGSLASLLLNPVVLSAVGIAVAALAGREAFYKYALPKIAPFVNDLITANIERMYGVGNSKKGVFITKLRDQYGRTATKADYNKMTADEKTTAQFLSMYDDELQNRQKINDKLFRLNSMKDDLRVRGDIEKTRKELDASDQKIRMLEDQIVVQGIKLLELQDLYENTGVLPETSLSKRLYPSTKQKKFDGPSSTTKPSPAKPQTTLVSQSSLPALPPTGIDPTHGAAQMYGASREGGRRKHAGQDFDAGPNDTFYSRIGGEVIYSDNAGGGYGNVVDVYNADLNHTERIAEGDVNLVKKGDIISPGTPVQRGTSQTGVFHYEIRTGRATASGSFSGTVDPIAFLNNLGNIQVAKTKPSTSTPAVSQYAPYEQPAGTPALVPIPTQSQQQQQPQVASNVMQPSSSGPTHEQVLNTYYTYQVLGFLYKQG